MQEASIIGIDLAKNTFQLHGAAPDGAVVFRKKLSSPPGAQGREDRTAHDDTRRGRDLRDSSPRLRASNEHVRQRARLRRLGRADPAIALDRRQGPFGQ